MYHLVIDTCVWIDLAKKFTEVRGKISRLVEEGKLALLVPQIVVEEWDRHKEPKIIDERESSVRGKIKNARDLAQYLDAEQADSWRGLVDGIQERKAEIVASAVEEVKAIDGLFAHPSTVRLPITDDVKLRAVDIALAKEAPFRRKNSMADALIVLTAVDHIEKQGLHDCIFVSSNTEDFSSDGSQVEIHEDLQPLFDENGIKYYPNIGLAVNEIEKGLVPDDTLDALEPRSDQEPFLMALAEFQRRASAMVPFFMQAGAVLADRGLGLARAMETALMSRWQVETRVPPENDWHRVTVAKDAGGKYIAFVKRKRLADGLTDSYKEVFLEGRSKEELVSRLRQSDPTKYIDGPPQLVGADWEKLIDKVAESLR